MTDVQRPTIKQLMRIADLEFLLKYSLQTSTLLPIYPLFSWWSHISALSFGSRDPSLGDPFMPGNPSPPVSPLDPTLPGMPFCP